jgi:hypothetical protein
MIASPQQGDVIVQHRSRRAAPDRKAGTKPNLAQRVFGPMVEAGAAAYVRARDLPKLIALWPHELADESPEGRRRVLVKLRRALRAERRRGLAGHWSYDLNRHLGLLSAFRGERALLEKAERPAQPNCTCRDKDRAGA